MTPAEVLILLLPSSPCVPISSLGTTVHPLWKPRVWHHCCCLSTSFRLCRFNLWPTCFPYTPLPRRCNLFASGRTPVVLLLPAAISSSGFWGSVVVFGTQPLHPEWSLSVVSQMRHVGSAPVPLPGMSSSLVLFAWQAPAYLARPAQQFPRAHLTIHVCGLPEGRACV